METPHPFLAFLKNKDRVDWKAFSQVLLNATRDGVTAVDENGTVAFSNLAAREGLNLYPGTLLPEVLSGMWPEVKATLEDRRYRFGISVQNNERAWLAKLSPILWEKTSIGVLCFFEDRTEVEKVTHQMISYQELVRELDTIINTSYDGLWICDADANVIRVNPASARINKVEASEVVGRNMRELVDEGYVDQSVTLKVLETRSVVNILQRTRNGRKLVLTGNPVLDEAGNVIRVVVNERDITEIDQLYRDLEEQSAIHDQYRHHMLEMQLEEIESRRIIAKSPCMVNTLRQALKVSGVDSTVLITGESGVGKGMIARLIHKYSARSKQPMIEINCGAIPETLLEAELFGYERGAFTGADTRGKPGYFELADGGILFLDEIGELPLSSQVKLLRFLEDGLVSRVGGTLKRKVDVRVLTATNRNLEGMVEEGTLRLDLFYRLNVIPIHIPRLRERRECILPLIHHYIETFSERLNLEKNLHFTQKASDALLNYTYPGNVRELMNLCERLVVMSEGPRIDTDDLPGEFLADTNENSIALPVWDESLSLPDILWKVEEKILKMAIRKYGSQMKAAEALGINQSTVARKLRRCTWTENK